MSGRCCPRVLLTTVVGPTGPTGSSNTGDTGPSGPAGASGTGDTGPTGPTQVLINQTLFVDSVYGLPVGTADDMTKAWDDINTAFTAAVALGGPVTIHVQPGDYTVTLAGGIAASNISYYFEPGAHITSDGTPSAIFSLSGGTEFRVQGYADFDLVNPTGILCFFNNTTNVIFECNTIEMGGAGTCFFVLSTTVLANIKDVELSVSATFLTVVTGETNINVDHMNLTGDNNTLVSGNGIPNIKTNLNIVYLESVSTLPLITESINLKVGTFVSTSNGGYLAECIIDIQLNIEIQDVRITFAAGPLFGQTYFINLAANNAMLRFRCQNMNLTGVSTAFNVLASSEADIDVGTVRMTRGGIDAANNMYFMNNDSSSSVVRADTIIMAGTSNLGMLFLMQSPVEHSSNVLNYTYNGPQMSVMTTDGLNSNCSFAFGTVTGTQSTNQTVFNLAGVSNVSPATLSVGSIVANSTVNPLIGSTGNNAMNMNIAQITTTSPAAVSINDTSSLIGVFNSISNTNGYCIFFNTTSTTNDVSFNSLTSAGQHVFFVQNVNNCFINLRGDKITAADTFSCIQQLHGTLIADVDYMTTSGAPAVLFGTLARGGILKFGQITISGANSYGIRSIASTSGGNPQPVHRVSGNAIVGTSSVSCINVQPTNASSTFVANVIDLVASTGQGIEFIDLFSSTCKLTVDTCIVAGVGIYQTTTNSSQSWYSGYFRSTGGKAFQENGTATANCRLRNVTLIGTVSSDSVNPMTINTQNACNSNLVFVNITPAVASQFVVDAAFA